MKLGGSYSIAAWLLKCFRWLLERCYEVAEVFRVVARALLQYVVDEVFYLIARVLLNCYRYMFVEVVARAFLCSY